MSELSINEKVMNYLLQIIKNANSNDNLNLPTEAELSERLSVSRSSIREALKTLQNIGIIYSIRGSGYKVEKDFENSLLKLSQILFDIMSTKYTYENIKDIREGLEIKTLLILQEKALQDDDIKLFSYIENMNNKIEPEENDKNFHLKLASMTENPLMIFISKALLLNGSQNYILIPWNKIDDEAKDKLVRSHKKIIDWIRKKGKKDIIQENPVSEHYQIANTIIAKEHNLQDDASLINYTISELLKMGISDNELFNLIKKAHNEINSFDMTSDK